MGIKLRTEQPSDYNETENLNNKMLKYKMLNDAYYIIDN